VHFGVRLIISHLCLIIYCKAKLLYSIFSCVVFSIHYKKVDVWDQINPVPHVKSKAFSTVGLSDILRLVEIIPIDNGKLKKSINAKVPFNDLENNVDQKTLIVLFGQEEATADGMSKKKETISFRDVVRLLIKFLKGSDIKESKIALGGRLEELRKIGITYPAQYLLFDFCLAALEGDHLDAKLYLAHGFQILGLSQRFNLFLSAVVYIPLTEDEEVRELLTLLAVISQPADAKVYLELYGEDFKKRYDIFQNELMKIK
jgi:hypothetical protein